LRDAWAVAIRRLCAEGSVVALVIAVQRPQQGSDDPAARLNWA